MKQDFTFKEHKIAILLATLSAAVVIFQANRFCDLYDSSYIIDNSYRISIGQVPYKDFLLHTTPGTYIIQAFIMKVFGSTLYPQIIYCSLISFLTYLLTYRILFFFNNDKWFNLAITLPVSIGGGYAVMSIPFYDVDCLLLILLSLFLVLYCYKKSFPAACTILAGFLTVIPAFFKQNVGLVYLVMIHLTFIGSVYLRKGDILFKQYLRFSIGSVIAILIFLIYIFLTSGIGNFLYCTIGYAYKFRVPKPVGFIQDTFNLVILRRTLFWLLIAVVIKYLKLKKIWLWLICFSLMLSPIYLFPLRNAQYYDIFPKVWPVTIIICTLTAFYSLMKVKEVSIFIILLLFTVVVVVITTWLPHSYATYAVPLSPLLALLYALLFSVLSKSIFSRNSHLLAWLIITNSLIITFFAVIYVISNHHYYWIRGYEIKEKIHYSTTANLRGLAIPGEYVPNMDNFINFAQKEIPSDQAVIILPHEDPFYFATGRFPLFPLFMHDVTLDIYTPEEILEKVNSYNVKWLVIKTITQGVYTGGSWDNLGNLTLLLKKEFTLYKTLPGYEIYKRGN